jgi:hypothetical protein
MIIKNVSVCGELLKGKEKKIIIRTMHAADEVSGAPIDYLDVRLFGQGRNGQFYATKSGVTLGAKHINDFIIALGRARMEFAAVAQSNQVTTPAGGEEMMDDENRL